MELVALRQQVAVLKRKQRRPRLNAGDRMFWVALRRFWPRWKDALLIVQPDTVVGWRRACFRMYWRRRPVRAAGRPKTSHEIREAIRRMARENAGWGAPRIHGELLKLGFEVSERSVARYLRTERREGDRGRSWAAFLKNHKEVIAAADFFSVPSVRFRLLHCFFVIEHARREILHCNVTANPTSEWVVQQLREAFPEAGRFRFMILDRDSRFDANVISFLKACGLEAKRTSIGSPWQNGVAERWVGGCRREFLDHVIPLNEGHLRRLMREYAAYYQADRIHDALAKDAPQHRRVARKPHAGAKLGASARLGGCTTGTVGGMPRSGFRVRGMSRPWRAGRAEGSL